MIGPVDRALGTDLAAAPIASGAGIFLAPEVETEMPLEAVLVDTTGLVRGLGAAGVLPVWDHAGAVVPAVVEVAAVVAVVAVDDSSCVDSRG